MNVYLIVYEKSFFPWTLTTTPWILLGSVLWRSASGTATVTQSPTCRTRYLRLPFVESLSLAEATYRTAAGPQTLWYVAYCGPQLTRCLNRCATVSWTRHSCSWTQWTVLKNVAGYVSLMIFLNLSPTKPDVKIRWGLHGAAYTCRPPEAQGVKQALSRWWILNILTYTIFFNILTYTTDLVISTMAWNLLSKNSCFAFVSGTLLQLSKFLLPFF